MATPLHEVQNHIYIYIHEHKDIYGDKSKCNVFYHWLRPVSRDNWQNVENGLWPVLVKSAPVKLTTVESKLSSVPRWLSTLVCDLLYELGISGHICASYNESLPWECKLWKWVRSDCRICPATCNRTFLLIHLRFKLRHSCCADLYWI